VLSDHEQRALEEIERRYETGAPEWSATRSHPPGLRALAVVGCISVVLLIMGAAVAALALATAGGVGWLFWGLWTRRPHGEAEAAPMSGAGHGGSRSARRPGESVRRYLRWMSGAE
jgi:Protein of unknown function (DUF3040)